jgi:hypothetical protein
MLQQVLQEVKSAQGPINLNELAHKLGVERSALDGMIQFWVRKGRLKDDDLQPDVSPDTEHCPSCHIGATCSGPKSCPFVMTMPKTYSLNLVEKGEGKYR